MDVVSLLNTAGANPISRTDSFDNLSAPLSLDDSTTTTPTTAESTPSPDASPDAAAAHRGSEPRQTATATAAAAAAAAARGRTPWDGGGYSLPLTLDTKFLAAAAQRLPAVYAGSPTDSLVAGSFSAEMGPSSFSPAPSDMARSVGNMLPMAYHQSRSIFPVEGYVGPDGFGEKRIGYYTDGARPSGSRPESLGDNGDAIRVETKGPNTPRHKCSDSSGSWSSSYTRSSSLSGDHSRISSLSTVSGFYPPLNGLMSEILSSSSSSSMVQKGPTIADISIDSRPAPPLLPPPSRMGDMRVPRIVPMLDEDNEYPDDGEVSPRHHLGPGPRPGSPSDAFLMGGLGLAGGRRDSPGSDMR